MFRLKCKKSLARCKKRSYNRLMIKGVVRLVLGGYMKLKRVAALVLAGVLCLTALTGCGAKADETIAALGNEHVTYGVANFLMKYQKATIDDMYTMYAGYYGVESLWDVDMSGSGSTTEEEFKASAMDLLHDMYTLKAHMADYGVEITAEDETAIADAVNAFLAANTQEAIEEFGATEETVTELLTLYTIQAKMYQAIIADTDREVSDEEANMRGYSMIQIDLSGTYDESGALVEYTEEELDQIKKDALEMNLDLNVKEMEEVAVDYNYTVTTGAYGKEDTSLQEAVRTALDALAEGEVSDMIETESAIYFVRIDADVDEEATAQNREAIIAERENTLYDETVAKWQENDGWDVKESVVEKIDFHNIFTQVKETENEAATEEGTEQTGVSETVDGTESN